MRELPHPGMFANYRVCPGCHGMFTVDDATKRRQLACLPVAIASLAFTLMMYYGSMQWLAPAVVTYVVIALMVYRGNKLVFLVPYEE